MRNLFVACMAFIIGSSMAIPAFAKPKKAVMEEKKQEEMKQEEAKQEVTQSQVSQAQGKVLVVYTDMGAKENNFAPTGWMGDYGDIKIKSDYNQGAYSGKTCIKIIYNARMTQGAGWSGIYWQSPNGNWGQDSKGGLDLIGAKKLTFWARGEMGGEIISEFKMGGISGEFGDTDTRAIGPVTLTKQWQQYSIDLEGADLSNIIGGFCWSSSKDDNPNGFVIYLDDIQYEY